MMSLSIDSGSDDRDIEAGDDEESKVDDKQEFSNFEDDGFRMHEPLWRAIEKNDLPAATKFLQLNEIIE